MSGATGNGNSKNIPAPPPLPPPPLQARSKEKSSKLKTKEIFNKKNQGKIRSNNTANKQPSKPKSTKPTKQTIPLPPPLPSSSLAIKDEQSEERIPQQSKSRKKNNNNESVMEITRNDVPFFNEEECTDSEDEFSFPCCLQPNSPRFPPNPRPYREWDPSFLPSSTNIPTSIGRKCRRCGKPVYVAELYLSSRGVYHSECYKCCLCGKTLDSWSVAEFKGEVFCKGCYRRNFGTHGCGFGVGAGVLQTP